MPMPIRPVHELESNDMLKNYTPVCSDAGISALQAQLMGIDSGERKAGKVIVSQKMLQQLASIAESEDETITIAATLAVAGHEPKTHYRVPRAIEDYDLLGLKTQGLVLGQGRMVTLTAKGESALRDGWLGEENILKTNRTQTRFDITASAASQMTRTASATDAAPVSGTGKFKRVS